ncbi:putative e3 ubiquitin ligase, partial [Globisporangium splendens]
MASQPPPVRPNPQTAHDIPHTIYEEPSASPASKPDTHAAMGDGPAVFAKDITCAICLQQIVSKQPVKQLCCAHVFHAVCVDQWLRQEIHCPICKTQVLFPKMHPETFHAARAMPLHPQYQHPQQYQGHIPMAVPVPAPLDGTNPELYGVCRDCQTVFYRDPNKVRPDTGAWFRCPQCRGTDLSKWTADGAWRLRAAAPVRARRRAMWCRCKSGTGSVRNPLHYVGINVLDDVGVWNVAQVRSIPSKGKVTVRYEGWGPEFDEAVPFQSGRIAPFHTYTSSVKCWAKYLNWPWWPGVATIRVPGNDDGIANLQTVDKLFVNFLDKKQFTFWVKKKDVRSFDHNFEENCKGSTDRDFEFSLNHVFQSTAGVLLPRFGKGTLPKQFENRAAPSIDVKKDVVGREKWLEGFVKNREMHFQMHGGNEEPMVTKSTTKKGAKVKKSEPVEEVEEEPSPKLGKRAAAAKAKTVALVLNEVAAKPTPVTRKGKALTAEPVEDEDDDSDDDASDNGGGPYFGELRATKAKPAKEQVPVKKSVVVKTGRKRSRTARELPDEERHEIRREKPSTSVSPAPARKALKVVKTEQIASEKIAARPKATLSNKGSKAIANHEHDRDDENSEFLLNRKQAKTAPATLDEDGAESDGSATTSRPKSKARVKVTVVVPKPPRVMNAVSSIPPSQKAAKESKHARNTVVKEPMEIRELTKEKKRSVRNENTEINTQAGTQSSQPPLAEEESIPNDNSFDFHQDVPEVTPAQAPAVIVESLKPWNGLFVNPRSVEEEEKGAAANDMSSRARFSTGGRASKMRVGSFVLHWPSAKNGAVFSSSEGFSIANVLKKSMPFR